MQKQRAVEKRLKTIQRLLDAIHFYFEDVVIGVINNEFTFRHLDGRNFNEIDLAGFEQAGTNGRRKPLQLDTKALSRIKKAFEGEPVNSEFRSNGKIYKMMAMPVPDSNHHISEVLCMMQNITEQKHMEEGLLKALGREKELGELKSRFVTMASHEFRTPLTAILASTFVLENYVGPNFEKEKSVNLNRIKRSVNSLTTILNEFLSLQKLEENKVKLIYSEVNIPEYIQDDLIGEIEVLKKPGQTIDYQHFGPSMTHVDHQLFWSIFTNLLTNSLKYSRPNDTIRVTSELKDHTVKIVVEDDGIGIPANEHKHIFGRFYRASNALNIEGTGLGLHIVQKYVQLLGGTITFESELDKGTHFTVVLPEAKQEHIKKTEHIVDFK